MGISIEIENEESGEEEGYEEYDVKCAADTLLRAEEIKKDMKLMELVKAALMDKRDAITSIAGLKKVAKKKLEETNGVKPELMTDEDKAAIQEMDKVNKNIKDMGFKVEE
jgi:hypothetical protein